MKHSIQQSHCKVLLTIHLLLTALLDVNMGNNLNKMLIYELRGGERQYTITVIWVIPLKGLGFGSWIWCMWSGKRSPFTPSNSWKKSRAAKNTYSLLLPRLSSRRLFGPQKKKKNPCSLLGTAGMRKMVYHHFVGFSGDPGHELHFGFWVCFGKLSWELIQALFNTCFKLGLFYFSCVGVYYGLWVTGNENDIIPLTVLACIRTVLLKYFQSWCPTGLICFAATYPLVYIVCPGKASCLKWASKRKWGGKKHSESRPGSFTSCSFSRTGHEVFSHTVHHNASFYHASLWVWHR